MRIERVIRAQPYPADQEHVRGFYDFMLGHQSQAAAPSGRLAVSYQQGWAKGQQRRVALNGQARYETEKTEGVGKCFWRIYREGYFQAEGNARSENRADQQIEDSKADLMDLHGDWATPTSSALAAKQLDEDKTPSRRRATFWTLLFKLLPCNAWPWIPTSRSARQYGPEDVPQATTWHGRASWVNLSTQTHSSAVIAEVNHRYRMMMASRSK